MNKLVEPQGDEGYNVITTQKVEDMFEIRKKICLLGESGVGKTSLIRRFVYNSFGDKYLPTMGTKVSQKKMYVPINNEKGKSVTTPIILAIWDVIGQQDFHSLVLKYFKNSNGGLMVVDGTRPETITFTRNWIESFFSIAGEVPIFILINKSDLFNIDTFDLKPFEELSSEFDTSYFFTSAKSGANVETGFTHLAESLIKGSDDDRKITELVEVADAIVVDFCEILGGHEKAMPIVNHQFKKAGVNPVNPTKEQLLAAMQNLIIISQDLQGPELAKREYNKFLQILEKF